MIAFAEQARVSKWLATIDTQVPVELDLISLQLDPPDSERLGIVFEELEFRTLAKRVLGSSVNSGMEASDTVEETRPKSIKKALPSNPLQTSLFDSSPSAVEELSSEELEEGDEEAAQTPKSTIADVEHSYRIALTMRIDRNY